jgi:hypothetical protein
MPLHLIEITPADADTEVVRALLDRVADAVTAVGGELVDAQVTADAKRAFAVAEHDGCAAVRSALTGAEVPVDSVEPVRLIGADLQEVKRQRHPGRYLVEWDLPEDLTMEAYLARKKANAPRYAEVPEATFLRTYVREDLDKCLCFYDATDAEAVRRARAAVSAPVDRFHELQEG